MPARDPNLGESLREKTQRLAEKLKVLLLLINHLNHPNNLYLSLRTLDIHLMLSMKRQIL